jgi:hypothetical protein
MAKVACLHGVSPIAAVVHGGTETFLTTRVRTYGLHPRLTVR